MIRRFFILLPVITALGSCRPNPPVVPEGVEKCEGFCIVLEHFECPEKGESREVCTAKCERVAGLGYLWTDDSSGPSCGVKATTIDELRACNVRCER
ncbi:MAG: hypothetical protein WC565_04205 [Parcubacteria group bacterium]|jgi:hypothetical protein